jgi:hypothetical protein
MIETTNERGGAMCLTCGCGEPHNDHGDPAHITFEKFKEAADAAEISVEEAAQNLKETLEKV